MLHSHLRLRHLRCFLETARLGSLSAAAEALHVSQPAASKTIRELEEILGAQLFDRSGRKLVLSAAGKVYQTHAGTALADLERAQRLVLSPPLERPRLHVGVLPTAATGLVPRAALAFRDTHPEVLLDVMTGPNWLLLSLLREGQLDLVVGRMPSAGNTEGLNFRRLYWERVVPVVRAGHPLLRRQDWDYADLTRHPLMLPPAGALIANSVRTWLHSVGIIEPQPAYENVSLSFGREVVLRSDTVWFISEGVVRAEIETGALVILPIRNELLGGPVGISLRASDEPRPEAQALIATLERASDGG
ncbi:LysR family transcriptional regulator, pca operon transcriptional activator [Paracoccus alcaliphilus]|uniref:LysR family transcriptional regulator, pca operon transcriptional activator n=1 Tax=Paracoccus alcaliphilus TaxID=34002 RepID=A0A1H8F060_9RHOB|nr:LysR substrate-binding domain-containing protein [Paracoccus alcaliphilus]WCR20070.1 LysR family transcriptional regulator [Paracoccus alcaliphilus]SEN25105.1 LysR family transcriptional regulator, pca operon transcriptional activator [Paracoccus alcaliphilus]